jgi:hypothetical protein
MRAGATMQGASNGSGLSGTNMDKVYYETIALAEKAITDAGYVRNGQKHIWVNGSKTAKVVREGPPWKFYVLWA